jgi:hypothetical protein
VGSRRSHGRRRGKKGYEFNLITRAREAASDLQAAVLASVGRSGPHLVLDIEQESQRDTAPGDWG